MSDQPPVADQVDRPCVADQVDQANEYEEFTITMADWLGEPRNEWEREMLSTARRYLTWGKNHLSQAQSAANDHDAMIYTASADMCLSYADGILMAVRRRRQIDEIWK